MNDESGLFFPVEQPISHFELGHERNSKVKAPKCGNMFQL